MTNNNIVTKKYVDENLAFGDGYYLSTTPNTVIEAGEEYKKLKEKLGENHPETIASKEKYELLSEFFREDHEVGKMYYNTVESKIYISDGSQWLEAKPK